MPTCVTLCTYGSHSLLPPRGVWWSNSGPWAWQQAPLPAEPSPACDGLKDNVPHRLTFEHLVPS